MITKHHFPWSFSSLGLFSCPKKYEILRAKKILRDPPSTAGNEGTRIHALIENYFLKDEWHDDLLPYKRLLNMYKDKNGQPEYEIAFKWIKDVGSEKQHLVRCAMDDPNTWVRLIIDWVGFFGEQAEIADWKTGRVKPSKQLQLYAWSIFMLHPEVNKIKGTFHWINHKDQQSDQFTREQFEEGELFAPFSEILLAIDECYETDQWPMIRGEVNRYGKYENCAFCVVTNEHCVYGITPEQYEQKHRDAEERMKQCSTN